MFQYTDPHKLQSLTKVKNKMKKIIMAAALLIGFTTYHAYAAKLQSELFLSLPETFNSPASSDFDKEGNIYFTSPNFHNDALIKSGEMQKPALPTIGKIDKLNKLTTWYTFKAEDMEKSSDKVAPMGIGFGPDGNAYVADMQLWFNGESRLIRINVKDGKAVSTDVVITGFTFPNGAVWKGNELFVSDTVLKSENGTTISGVYKFNIQELSADKPIQIKPFVSYEDNDAHLFETFESTGLLNFGANGLTIDGDGNLYTAIMEEGSVHKTTMDKNNKKIKTSIFATGMIATDGLKWDKRTNKIYIADLFANAIYSIDMNGKLELLAQNGDTDGSNGELDAPAEVIVRGDEIIVTNFDAVFDSAAMTNKTAEKPITLSVIKLK